MAGYVGNPLVPQATQTREDFTATASQTTFTTLGYTPGYLDVYLNGVRLQDSDVTATDGTTFQIAACAAGDSVSAVAWSTFNVTNVDYSNVQNAPTALSSFTNDSGYTTYSANQALDSTSSPTFATANVTTIDLGDWTITESSGTLYFAYQGTNKLKLESSGALTVTDDITGFGTV